MPRIGIEQHVSIRYLVAGIVVESRHTAAGLASGGTCRRSGGRDPPRSGIDTSERALWGRQVRVDVVDGVDVLRVEILSGADHPARQFPVERDVAAPDLREFEVWIGH